MVGVFLYCKEGGDILALYSKCRNCGKLIPYRTKRCEKCQTEWNKQKEEYRNEDIKRFRSSGVWTRKSKQVLKDSNYQCQICKDKNIVAVATEVHHIMPLSIDFNKRLDDDNLIALCEGCHHDIHRLPPPKGVEKISAIRQDHLS